MPQCVALGCNNNGNHRFPKDLRMKKLWEMATKIKNFKACKNSRLCSKHFIETDYQGIASSTGLPQVNRFLKRTAVPSVFSWNKEKSSTEVAREQRYLQLTSKRQLPPPTSQELIPGNNIQVSPKVSEFQYEVEIPVSTADRNSTNPIKNSNSNAPYFHTVFIRENSKKKEEFINKELERLKMEVEYTKERNKVLTAENTSLKRTVDDLSARVTLIEQNLRKDNLKISGIPKHKSENLIRVLQLRKVVSSTVTKNNVLSAVRIRKLDPKNNHPYSIMVKLSDKACKKDTRD